MAVATHVLPKGAYLQGFVTMLVTGVQIGTIMFAFGVFVEPMQKEFNTTRSVIQAQQTVGWIVGGATAPLQGKVTNRIGCTASSVLGMLLLAAGWIIRGASGSVLELYVGMLVTFLGWQMSVFVVPGILMSQWFGRYKGRAIGFAIAGANIFAGFVIPICSAIILASSWREACYFNAGCAAFIAVIAGSILRERVPAAAQAGGNDEKQVSTDGEKDVKEQPPPPPVTAGFTVAQGLRSPYFWLTLVGVTLTQFTFVGVLICIFPHIVSVGVPWESATAMASAIALIGFFFKLLAGRLAESFSAQRLLALCNVVQAGTMLAFASLGTSSSGSDVSIVGCWVACVIYGCAMGGVGPLISIIQIDVFGLRSFAVLGGYVQMSAQIIPGIVGPLASGRIYDDTGSYNGWFYTMIGVYLVAAGAILCTRKYREEVKDDATPDGSTSVAV